MVGTKGKKTAKDKGPSQPRETLKACIELQMILRRLMPGDFGRQPSQIICCCLSSTPDIGYWNVVKKFRFSLHASTVANNVLSYIVLDQLHRNQLKQQRETKEKIGRMFLAGVAKKDWKGVRANTPHMKLIKNIEGLLLSDDWIKAYSSLSARYKVPPSEGGGTKKILNDEERAYWNKRITDHRDGIRKQKEEELRALMVQLPNCDEPFTPPSKHQEVQAICRELEKISKAEEFIQVDELGYNGENKKRKKYNPYMDRDEETRKKAHIDEDDMAALIDEIDNSEF